MRGKTVINLFFENSTRTRTSFEIAAKRLSADAVNISPSTSSAAKGETLLDTAKNLDAMGPDVVVVRHAMGGAPHLLAKTLRCAVVNAGDGQHEHPTQALLDAATMRRAKGAIDGLEVAIVGDLAHSRVARSNLLCLTKLGARVRLCAPWTLLPPGLTELGLLYRELGRVDALVVSHQDLDHSGGALSLMRAVSFGSLLSSLAPTHPVAELAAAAHDTVRCTAGQAWTWDGVRFTNFYTHASCSPTRSMLLTGLDNHEAGLGNMAELVAANQVGKPERGAWSQGGEIVSCDREIGLRLHRVGDARRGPRMDESSGHLRIRSRNPGGREKARDRIGPAARPDAGAAARPLRRPALPRRSPGARFAPRRRPRLRPAGRHPVRRRGARGAAHPHSQGHQPGARLFRRA